MGGRRRLRLIRRRGETQTLTLVRGVNIDPNPPHPKPYRRFAPSPPILSVDFNLGDTLILDRYNGKNASLVCHLLKNDDIYPKYNSKSNGSSSNVSIISNCNGHGNKDEEEMVETAQNPKEVIKSKEDLEKEYNSLPNRGTNVIFSRFRFNRYEKFLTR